MRQGSWVPRTSRPCEAAWRAGPCAAAQEANHQRVRCMSTGRNTRWPLGQLTLVAIGDVSTMKSHGSERSWLMSCLKHRFRVGDRGRDDQWSGGGGGGASADLGEPKEMTESSAGKELRCFGGLRPFSLGRTPEENHSPSLSFKLMEHNRRDDGLASRSTAGGGGGGGGGIGSGHGIEWRQRTNR